MYLMGQVIFSVRLLRRRFRPKSVRGIILCSADDAVLRPMLRPFRNIEVRVIEGVPVLPSEAEEG
jgi:hypothetical protein